ncbi:YqiJ family protein [Stieleria sp. JC731]|uniref:OB-fold-containig protein n=1 Tax=Pirellulaceae TaxID=2691357 RepID=UPI001E61A5EE|nr:OB-fold-containig protein [Stieleria sp. JC731]MCC9603113.1 YqiJ family protein [Stieleria sp. JC731]
MTPKGVIAVEEAFKEFLDRMFVGPVWPASVMVCLLVLYALVAVIGLIDLGLDGDVDMDGSFDAGPDLDVAPDLDGIDMDAPGGDVDLGDFEITQGGLTGLMTGVGAMTLRLTNFGRVPLVIWFGVFTIVFWAVSYGLWYGLDSAKYAPTLLPTLLFTIRNGVIAIVATKLATEPLVGKFDPQPGYDKDRLLGGSCEISSLTATTSFGQAKFRTNAAPLLLNVRTTGAEIPKGTVVRIVDFDPSRRIYTVTEIKPENQT